MSANGYVKVAVKPGSAQNNAGQVRIVEGAPVEFVAFGSPCHIRVQKYTKDYRNVNARPFVLDSNGRGYASLAAAIRALFKNGFVPV
jgi:hypothetical protein